MFRTSAGLGQRPILSTAPAAGGTRAPQALGRAARQRRRSLLGMGLTVSAVAHLGVLASLMGPWWAANALTAEPASIAVDLVRMSPPAAEAHEMEREDTSDRPTSTVREETQVATPVEPTSDLNLHETVDETDRSSLASPQAAPPPAPTSAPSLAPASPAIVAPMAQRMSSPGVDTWQGRVLARLESRRRYPASARSARLQGVVLVRFVMNREGEVLSSELERSSGLAALDQEAVVLPSRSAPLPSPPDDMLGDMIELVVPVQFSLE